MNQEVAPAMLTRFPITIPETNEAVLTYYMGNSAIRVFVDLMYKHGRGPQSNAIGSFSYAHLAGKEHPQ